MGLFYLRRINLPPNSQAALAQLQQEQSQAQNPNQILESQRQSLGVQGAQDTVTGLRGAINNTTRLLKQVAPGVMGRTQQSLVTQGQANRIIQNEEAPISERLSDQGRDYSFASEDLGRLEDRAGKAASGLYQGQQDKLSYLQNLYATLYGREQDAARAAAEERERQEQIRQFNASLAKSGSSGGSGAGVNFSSPAKTSNPLQDAAYLSVQHYLGQGRARAQSDYEATLKSANYGNAMDKLKVQLYNQMGIGVGGKPLRG